MRALPKTIIRLISYWPPFIISGISVKDFNMDEGWVISQLKSRFWNSNAFGTHYGGSLFSMCDPFYVFLLSHKLGSEYYVWDYASDIKFVSATPRPVQAKFQITDEVIDNIKVATCSGEKYLSTFTTQVTDQNGKVVAEVSKTIYVRLKPQHRPDESV